MEKLQQNRERVNSQAVLEITTLGKFQVKYREKALTREASRSYRMWELFKYLLTNREQSVLPEMLVEKLWPEQEYADAKSAVRTQVYRLRQFLASSTGEPGENFILFDQGSYRWNKKCKYWLDADEFEQLCQQAESLKQENPTDAIELLQKAVLLYKGEYLPEDTYSEWTVIQRHYYNRLYLECVISLGELLNEKNQYDEIITLCEKAIDIDPCVEQIHILYIEALLAQGRKKLAISHYGNVFDTFCRDMGINPSNKMSHLYKIIHSEDGIAEHDLTSIQNGLRESSVGDEAFYCDSVIFRALYQLEQRRANPYICIGMFTLIGVGPNGRQIGMDAMDHLQRVLASRLNRTDVFTRLNDSQYLCLLNTDVDNAKKTKIIERIEDGFWKIWDGDNQYLTVFSRLQPLLPAEKLAE